MQPLAYAGPPSKWPNAQALPSRFTPEDLSFTALFSTGAATGPLPLAATADAPAAPAGGIKPRDLLTPEAPAATSLFSGFGTR